MITRRSFCQSLLATSFVGVTTRSRRTTFAAGLEPEAALARAATWLWSQQTADGSWESDTYGLLASGQAYTPFILNVLLDVPESIVRRPGGAVDRVMTFILSHLNDDGALGLADPDVLEYPNYATADALHCLSKLDRPEDARIRLRMRRYLEDQQYREQNGFEQTHPAYGGWGFGGHRAPGLPGHMDLAHTRRVLGAIRANGCDDADLYRRAERFLHLVQKHPDAAAEQPSLTLFEEHDVPVPFDGGFYFSPVVLQANKGREETRGPRPYFRSYATATCDGLLSLLDSGVPMEDERVQAAVTWLADHPRLDYPEGIPMDFPEPWGDALRYYHYAVRSEVSARLDLAGDWRNGIIRQLQHQQYEDGSFRNTSSHLMKEDDPLLATGLALSALLHCRTNSYPLP